MKINTTALRLKDELSTDLYTLLTTGRVLYLTLNRNWYLKIASGEKKEEYRELKHYWLKRLLNINYPKEQPDDHLTIPADIEYDITENGYAPETVLKAYYSEFKNYDLIVFLNGYGNVPTTIVESKGIEIKRGIEKWGAVAKQFYVTLKLGKVLYTEPCS